MNFLRISGLVIGTIGVAGVAGAGIYYSDTRNNTNTSSDSKTDSVNTEDVLISGETPPPISEVTAIIGEDVQVNSGINNAEAGIAQTKNPKTQFVGKLIFLKKRGSGTSTNYEVKLINTKQYEQQKTTFDNNKSDRNKYDQVNKIVDVSYQLNIQEAKSKLRKIFVTPSLLSDIKTKITEKAIELQELFGEAIYTELKNIS